MSLKAKDRILDELVFHWRVHGTLLTTAEIAVLSECSLSITSGVLNDLRKSMTVMRGRRGFQGERLWRINDLYRKG